MEYSEIFDFAYDLAEKVCHNSTLELANLDLQASKIILEASAKRWVSTSDLNEKKNSVDVGEDTFEWQWNNV